MGFKTVNRLQRDARVLCPEGHALIAAGATDGPPFVRGLCSTHPAWTLPCPDCHSPYDWMGDDFLAQQISDNKVAGRWISDQLARGRFGRSL